MGLSFGGMGLPDRRELNGGMVKTSSIDGDAYGIEEHVEITRRPLISIVTINFNNSRGLARTLRGMAEQTYKNYEQIVVDGGSDDGSIDVIQDSNFKVDRWVSEPDNGIYHAMNKGIRMARGKYLLFLNSGDHLLEARSLATAAELLTDKDIYYFSLKIIPASGEGDGWNKTYPSLLTFSFFTHDTLPHQSSFLKSNLFNRFGLYDEQLRMGGDWKYFLMCVCRHNCSYSYDPRVIGVFYADGLSSSPEAPALHEAEHKLVLESEFPAFLDDLKQQSQDARMLARLRHSRVVKLAQSLHLLWRF